MTSSVHTKSVVKILNTLIRQDKHGVAYEKNGKKTALKIRQGFSLFPSSLIKEMLSDGLIVKIQENLTITSAGKAKLKRALCEHDPFVEQHFQLQCSNVKLHGQSHQVLKNCAESPLARLYSHKQKNGTRFLSVEEYKAGERLRNDFEKAQLQPSISVNWELGASTGNKRCSVNNSDNVSDIAIDAGKRLEKAINMIGPELTGVTLDVCCFLKGLGIVERERGWPCRSAKLMLKTALSCLARHYGLIMPAKFCANAANSRISQWGTSDYRPNL